MSRLAISLLGRFQVALDGQPVTTFESDRVRALLAYLAVEAGHPHSRSELASLLWPDHAEEAARTNLRHVLRKLREAIHDDAASPPFLLVTHGTLQLNPAADVELDVAAFNRRIAACEAHAHEHESLHTCPSCVAELTQAMALYGGPFLAGFSFAKSASFEEWARTAQEQLHRQALEALYQLTLHHEANGDYATTARFASWQVKLEPWREDAHAQWMRALALSGQREAAMLQFETCCRVLEQELGIGPSDGLHALAERIRTGELSSPANLTAPASAPPLNLPAQLTAFVGRERELSDITSQLGQPQVRLLTLVGPGGMGKTRLALEAAPARLDACPDGVFFISLAPIASASAIAPAITLALGISPHGDPKDAVLQFLRNKQLLLILDNFEHLLSESGTPPWGRRIGQAEQMNGADSVADILQAAPHVQIIVTSRERLNLHAEHAYLVQGLDYPRDNDQVRRRDLVASDWVAGMSASAVRLFVQSARRARPDFRLDEGNLPAVLRICELVGGMPLGLELAAAWAATLAPEAIAAEIEKSADFLASDWRDMPERQRSMRAVFDSSWKLLSTAEREAFARLSVFRGGCTREAAQSITRTPLRVLSKLVHKSLVRQTEMGRFDVHELLRQFAAEQLDAKEREDVEARHGAFYLEFIAARERRLARDEPREAAAEIQAELDNVRQAWAWAADRVRLMELDRSAFVLWHFYSFAGLAAEGAHAFGMAAERVRAGDVASTQSGQRVLGKLLACQAFHLIPLGKQTQAYRLAQGAVSLSQTNQGMEGEALGLMVQGQALRRMGQSAEAYSFLERAVALARRYQQDALSGEHFSELMPEVEWRAYGWLCSIALNPLRDYDSAQRLAEERLHVCASLSKLNGQMAAYTDLVDVAMARGDLETAQRQSERVLQLARILQSHWGEATGCIELASIATLKGDYLAACEMIERALAINRETGDAIGEATALTKLGRLNTLLGNYRRAAEWFNQLFHAVPVADMPAGERLDGLLALGWLAHDTSEYERALDYAAQARGLAQHQVADLACEAVALVIMGHAQVGLKRLAEAKSAFEQALAIYATLNDAQSAVEPRAGLAQVALAEGDAVQAKAFVEDILEVLADHSRAGLDEPFFTYLTCYRVLEANGDLRASAILQRGQATLQDYASYITDDALRQSFLENVATHRALGSAEPELL